MFALTHEPIDMEALRARLADPGCGASVCFEGWIRNRNQGREVLRLEYEAYEPLALKEGERILREARERFGVVAVHCVHRLGLLEIGEAAVWIGVAAPHRREAFAACGHVIDEIKRWVPIWKREHYADSVAQWIHGSACLSGHGDEPPAGTRSLLA